MVHFDYFAPKTISEAMSFLKEKNGEAKLLAGGTDLLVQLKTGEVVPERVIDLKNIDQLKGIDFSKSHSVRIGALTTANELLCSEFVKNSIPALWQASLNIGSVQVRNRASIGGNICRAAPSADFAPVLLVLDARLKIIGSTGERVVNLDTFFVGPGKTILTENEILKDIEIDIPSISCIVKYGRFSIRKTMDLSLAGVAVFLSMKRESGLCEDIRIAMGSVAPTPFRARKAEAHLVGKKLTPDLIKEASQMIADEVKPITDIYGSKWYKREIVQVQVVRIITNAFEEIGGLKNEA